MKTLLLSIVLLLSSLVYGVEDIQVKGSHWFGDLEFPQMGRGVAIDKNLIMSARHIVTGYKGNPLLSYAKIGEEWVALEEVVSDEKNDLVILKSPKELKSIVEVLSIPKIEAIGSPGMNKAKPRNATLEQFKIYIDEVKELPNVKFAHGLSGSAILAEGRLIGIISEGDKDAGGVFLLCVGPDPINNLIEKAKKKLEEGK